MVLVFQVVLKTDVEKKNLTKYSRNVVITALSKVFSVSVFNSVAWK